MSRLPSPRTDIARGDKGMIRARFVSATAANAVVPDAGDAEFVDTLGIEQIISR